MAPRKTVRSRNLGKSIRRLRLEAQLSQDALLGRYNEERTGDRSMSASHLSRLESGSARMSAEDLERLVTVLGAEQEIPALEELRQRADEQGWWHDYADLLSEPVEMLIELGEDATTARSYDLAFVQGLLQTREYAEAVVAGARAFVAPIDVDRMVDLRLRRQQRLGESDFEGLTAVMTEGVVRTLVGGPEVMYRQLQHLLNVGNDLPVTIHVLPFRAGALPGSDNLVVYGFDAEEDGDVVYVDSDTAQRIYENRTPVRQCMYTFDAALAQALTPRESAELIREVMKELT